MGEVWRGVSIICTHTGLHLSLISVLIRFRNFLLYFVKGGHSLEAYINLGGREGSKIFQLGRREF